MKTVGIKIDTRSTKYKDKIYYYKTDKKYKVGEHIRVQMPSGGTPESTIVVSDSNKKIKRAKKLLEENK